MVDKSRLVVAWVCLKFYFLSNLDPTSSEGGRADYTGIKLLNPGILGKNHGNQPIYLRAKSVIIPLKITTTIMIRRKQLGTETIAQLSW